MSRARTLLGALEHGLRGVRWERGAFRFGARRLPPADAEAWLTAWLYQHHFTQWDGGRGPDFGGDPTLVGALDAAAAGHRYFDEGWKPVGRLAGGRAVSNGRVSLFVPRGTALRPAPGGKVAVSFPCARHGWLPGYFCLVSRAGRVEASEVKLYLDLKPAGAAPWVRFLLTDAVLRGTRFEAKLFNHPASYGRRDSAVMYLEAARAPSVFAAVRRFVARHPRLVRPGHVPFTVPLARGLSAGASLAGEERDAQSYGELRCRLVARGVLAALRAGAPKEAWPAFLARAFAEAGADFERPFEGVARVDWDAVASPRVAGRGRRARAVGAAAPRTAALRRARRRARRAAPRR